MPKPTQYWLFKSEPDVYPLKQLKRDRQTHWDGVRNYQARNFLRDTMQLEDRVLFYHSNADPMAIVGTARIVKTGYVDHTAFDTKDPHYDPKSKPEAPTWYMVDIEFLQEFSEPLTRDALRADPVTAEMMLLKKGSRLSVQPVTEEEWLAVHRLAGATPL